MRIMIVGNETDVSWSAGNNHYRLYHDLNILLTKTHINSRKQFNIKHSNYGQKLELIQNNDL